MVGDIFKWMTLGVILAFGYTVLTHADEASKVLGSAFSGYNSTLSTLEGR